MRLARFVYCLGLAALALHFRADRDFEAMVATDADS
jgi:hypothetical protein